MNYFNHPPEIRHFQFVIVGLDDLPPDDAAKLVERLCDSFVSHGANIDCISSILVIGTFGLLNVEDSEEARVKLVGELLKAHGKFVRIAHGQCSSVVGNLGSKHRFNYMGLIPRLHEIREQLSETPIGTAFEVPEQK